MTTSEEILEVLRNIHDLLIPISACFEQQYEEIQRQQSGSKLKELEMLLTTSQRRRVFPLLFDTRPLSQVDIAKEAGTTQPTVSRLIRALLERGLIGQTRGQTGAVTYTDKFGLKRLVDVHNDQD